MRSLLRDTSGASAAEYALILATIGMAVAIAALILGPRLAAAANPTASFRGPGGAVYRCTANCQFEDHTYCGANRNPGNADPGGPQYTPNLPTLPKNAQGYDICTIP